MSRLPNTIAAAATLLALACSSATSDKHDSGSTGLGGAGGATGAGGAAGTAGGGASGATDGGCVAVCGMVTGVLADPPGSCTFSLPCSPPLGFTSLTVFVDEMQVPQDAAEGWTWAGTSPQSAVAIHGPPCTAVTSPNALVDVVYVVYLCELP